MDVKRKKCLIQKYIFIFKLSNKKEQLIISDEIHKSVWK